MDPYANRHRVDGWVTVQGRVYETTGYYCSNGNNLNDGLNVSVDGVVSPGPENDCPMYFFPSVGYSMGLESVHSTRDSAVEEARAYIRHARQALDALDAELNK